MYSPVRSSVEAFARENPEYGTVTDRVVLLDVRNGQVDGTLFLFFGARDTGPRLVAKAARSARGKQIFRTEADNLRTLLRCGMGGADRLIPQALGESEHGETLVTLQSALPGKTMKNIAGRELFSRGQLERTLDAVMHWWLAFQDCFGTRMTRIDDEIYEREVSAPLRLFLSRYRVESDETRMLRRIFDEQRALSGMELPLMARHADFCSANIVVQPSGNVGVFDWEFPLRHESPLFDLFFFFSSARFPHTGVHGESDHLDSFSSVFWEDSYFSEAMRERILSACRKYSIPPEALTDLFLLSLVQTANMKYRSLLEHNGLTEERWAREPSSAEQMERAWSQFRHTDKNAPFARIRRARYENLAVAAHRGPPVLIPR